jgi:hypothetical protein
MRTSGLYGSLFAVILISAAVAGYAACDYSETATITVGPQSVVCLYEQITLTASKACNDPDLVITNITWSGFPGAANCNGSMSCSVTPSSAGCVTPVVQIRGHNGDIGYCADSDGTVTYAVIGVTLADPIIWWFDGLNAQNYQESTTATADKGSCVGPVGWQITAGDTKVQLDSASANPATITSINYSYPANDVTISCLYNNVRVCDMLMTVKSPFSLEPGIIQDNPWADGFKSVLHYRILDQFATVLPSPVELNETWLSTDTSLYPGGDNWIVPLPNGQMVNPSDTKDNIGAKNNASGGAGGAPRSPTCVNPGAPGSGEKVQNWLAKISIGSTVGGSGAGMPVFFPLYVDYRGKGRHEPPIPP